MSESLGPLTYGESEGAYPGTGSANYSPAIAKVIDEEVRSIVDTCYGRAEKLLLENRDILDAMKDALMEYETIDAEQVEDLMQRRKVRPPREWHDTDFGGHKDADSDSNDTDDAEKYG